MYSLSKNSLSFYKLVTFSIISCFAAKVGIRQNSKSNTWYCLVIYLSSRKTKACLHCFVLYTMLDIMHLFYFLILTSETNWKWGWVGGAFKCLLHLCQNGYNLSPGSDAYGWTRQIFAWKPLIDFRSIDLMIDWLFDTCRFVDQ